MRLTEARNPRRAISLTPLIDVVFLLLVFFMLATTFLKFTSVSVRTGTPGAASLPAKELVLVHLTPGDTLTVNGRRLPRSRAVAEINRLHQLGARHGVLIVRGPNSVGEMLQALTLIRQSRLESVRVVR